MKKHLEVVAAIIENEDQILCMKRDVGKYEYSSLKWEFPGGKIEPGETKEDALKRELVEEMEMEVEILKPFEDIYYEYPDFTMNMYCFLCKAKSKKFVLNVHKDFVWLEKSKLSTLDWVPADKTIIDKLSKM